MRNNMFVQPLGSVVTSFPTDSEVPVSIPDSSVIFFSAEELFQGMSDCLI